MAHLSISQCVAIATALAVGTADLANAEHDEPPMPQHTSKLSGQEWVNELLNDHPARIHNNLGMHKHVFSRMVEWVSRNGGLMDTRWVSKEEQLAIFLYTAVTGLSNRKLVERFQRSGDTISK